MTMHRNAWGRLVDSPAAAANEVDAAALVAMFREVGLEEASASKAAAGLVAGTYLSFEDAAQSQLVWGSPAQRRRGLSSTRVAEVAARLGRGASRSVSEAATTLPPSSAPPNSRSRVAELRQALWAKYPALEGSSRASRPQFVDHDAARGVVRFRLGLQRELVEQSYVAAGGGGGGVRLIGVPRPVSEASSAALEETAPRTNAWGRPLSEIRGL